MVAVPPGGRAAGAEIGQRLGLEDGEMRIEVPGGIGAAKVHLLEYVNRRGENQPEGLTAAGLSLWRMEKADGTALGIKLPESAR
jgi:hypothetical protein